MTGHNSVVSSRWDYLVVGAGSAGCTVANRLAASGKHSVLLLEAGHHNRSWMFWVPSAPGIWGWSEYDWGYTSLADPTRGGKTEGWPRGRVLGGSSSINGMNHVRGAAHDFDRWAVLGNVGWSAREVMPLFRDLEHCDEAIRRVDMQGLRGYAGPLHVKRVSRRHPLTEAFVQAAQSAGHPFNPDYNGRSQEGIAYGQATQCRGRRWSAADAFLRSGKKPANLTVESGAQVHQILIKDGRAVGVKLEQQGGVREVFAERVILCAGAINTPQLLMLSGIGSAKALQELGIPVVVDRPAVGQGLVEHPLIRLTYRVNRPTYNLTRGVPQKLRFLAKYLAWGAGPLSMVVEALGFLKTRASEPEPDVQLHVLPFGWGVGGAANNTGKGGPGLAVAADYPCLSVLVNKNHPLSRGQVRLGSSDPREKMLIEPRLLDRQEDVETLVRSVAMVRHILAQPAIAPYVEEEVQPGVEVNSEENAEEFVRRFTEIAAHPAGTCRMGVDEAAVVTPKLEVRGVRNLCVADASIIPDLISGNTNAVCMMIGEKLGRMLIGL